MRRMLGFSIFALTLALALGAVPAFAEEAAVQAAASAVAAAPGQPDCGETLDLAAILSVKAEISPAVLSLNPAPELKAGRTCRCSCGQPCKKDEDCGPGGLCMGGITCC
jgi:hypothetical protein